MIKKNTFNLLFCVILLCSCNQSTRSELTDMQKEMIIEEIELIWKESVKGIEQLDVQRAFKSFSKKNAKYLRDGYLFESIDAAKEQYANWFTNSPGKGSLTFDPINYDILTENIVVITALGKHVLTDSSNSEHSTIVGYSMVWQKEEDNWKILNMHTSIR